MKDEYDVVVEGAGPGGSAAARVAAQECETFFIEKRQEIGDPVRCAEALLGGAMLGLVGLQDMKKTWISSEVKGARFHAPDGTTVDVTSEMFRMEEPLGYVLERKIFDRDLAKEAAGRGTRYGAHACDWTHYRRRRGHGRQDEQAGR